MPLSDGEPIEGTQYRHGQEVQHDTELSCPERCEIPDGCKLIQVVTPGTAFSIRCPNDGSYGTVCGIALRIVK